MLAPVDKLKTHVNDIIQIIITTACTLQCSNCTQLLPFRRDARHMSLECFRKACRSLVDWPGIVGVFGGNPCNHPKFPEICAILQEEIPDQAHRGLWSNDLLQHGAIVRETFYPRGRFNLNAHAVITAGEKIEQFLPGRLIPGSDVQPAMHAAILMDYKDFNIDESEWRRLRENCDINQKWSGAIAERNGKPFAYFCEVAASIDGVTGQNNGIPAVAGWWRHSIDAIGYQDQIRNCCDAGCGVPLKARGHLDSQQVYDISPSWKDATEQQRGTVTRQVHYDRPGTVRENTDYMSVRSGE